MCSTMKKKFRMPLESDFALLLQDGPPESIKINIDGKDRVNVKLKKGQILP